MGELEQVGAFTVPVYFYFFKHDDYVESHFSFFAVVDQGRAL